MKADKELAKRKILLLARALNDAVPTRRGTVEISKELRDEIVPNLYMLSAPEWVWEEENV